MSEDLIVSDIPPSPSSDNPPPVEESLDLTPSANPPLNLSSPSTSQPLNLNPPSPLEINPIVNLVKDIIFNLILNIPGLRTKLDALLLQPTMAVHQVAQVFEEVKSKLSPAELQRLTQYITADHSRNSLSGILHNAFRNIMEDGKIDVNDTAHIITLVYEIITLFNMTSQENLTNITIRGESVMFFLYFVIKSTLILTLEGDEEVTALALLDASFKLVSISVLPIIKGKCSCNPLACLKKKK